MNHRARYYLLNLLDEPAPGARFYPPWRECSAKLASRRLDRRAYKRKHLKETARYANFFDAFGRAIGEALSAACDLPDAAGAGAELGRSLRKMTLEMAAETRRAVRAE